MKRTDSRRVAFFLFHASRVLAIVLQFALALAVARRFERTLERPSDPYLASVGASTSQVIT